MKQVRNLLALAGLSVFGVACQGNQTAPSDPYSGAAQSYGGGAAADPYASSGEYDNVYASGGGQAYEQPATTQGGSYGNDDYYAQDSSPAYSPPSSSSNSYGSSGGSYTTPSTSSSHSGGSYSAPSSQSHTVQKGDTLYNISKRYGTTVSAIQSANGINGDLIRLGETLVIP